MLSHHYLLLSTACFHLITTPLYSYNPDHLTYALAERLNLQNLDLSDADLSNQNFSGCDLSNTDLSGANLSNTNLSFAQLFQTKMCNTILYRTNFERARLAFIDLSLTNWEQTLNLNRAAQMTRVIIFLNASSSVVTTQHPNYTGMRASSAEEDDDNDHDEPVARTIRKNTNPPVKVYYESTCTICTKTYTAGEEIAALPCGHTICLRCNPEKKEDGCIYKLIAEYGKRCPLCRKPFSNYSCVSMPEQTNAIIPAKKPN